MQRSKKSEREQWVATESLLKPVDERLCRPPRLEDLLGKLSQSIPAQGREANPAHLCFLLQLHEHLGRELVLGKFCWSGSGHHQNPRASEATGHVVQCFK